MLDWSQILDEESWPIDLNNSIKSNQIDQLINQIDQLDWPILSKCIDENR